MTRAIHCNTCHTNTITEQVHPKRGKPIERCKLCHSLNFKPLSQAVGSETPLTFRKVLKGMRKQAQRLYHAITTQRAQVVSCDGGEGMGAYPPPDQLDPSRAERAVPGEYVTTPARAVGIDSAEQLLDDLYQVKVIGRAVNGVILTHYVTAGNFWICEHGGKIYLLMCQETYEIVKDAPMLKDLSVRADEELVFQMLTHIWVKDNVKV